MAAHWRRTAKAAAGLVLLGLPGIAQAQIEGADSGDTGWMLAATAFVLIAALPGLALLYAGRVRAESAAPLAAQLGLVAAFVSLLWAALGYSLAFAAGPGWIGGLVNLGLANLGAVRDGTAIPESAFALFHMALALLAPALIVGALAERVRLGWLLPFAGLWSLFVYAPIAHWIWGGGWLARLGTLDYAGGLVVSASAGGAALVLALLIGPRASRSAAAHGPLLTLGGAGLFWVGALALAGGAALGASDDAAMAMLNLHLTIAASLLCRALLDRGRMDPAGTATAVMAGAAAGLSCAGYIGAPGAIGLGVAAALAAQGAAHLVRRLGIDDALGVFATQGVGGALGAALLAPLAASALGGAGYDAAVSPLAQGVAQLVGAGAALLWSALASLLLGLAVALFVPMRMAGEDEWQD